MTKELIIIALLILVIYLYSQQNQPNLSTNSPEIKQLQKEITHYQTLYQKRVEKDLGDSEKVKELEKQLKLCEDIINKPTFEIGTQTELSTEDIINLHKQVEYYQQLTEQKETDFSKEKSQWNQERIELKKKLVEKAQKHQQELTNIQDSLTNSFNEKQKVKQELNEAKTEHESQIEQLNKKLSEQAKITSIFFQTQLEWNKKEEKWKNDSKEKQTKIAELTQELENVNSNLTNVEDSLKQRKKFIIKQEEIITERNNEIKALELDKEKLSSLLDKEKKNAEIKKKEDRKIIEINDVATQTDKEETEAKTKEPIEKEKEVKK